MIKILIVGLASFVCLKAEAVPVCMAVTEDDARTILGPTAKRSKDPSGCQWMDTGHEKQMNLARIGVASMYERARADSAAKGRTQSEGGLGGTAFSTVPSKDHGGRAAIYLLKGSVVLVVDIEGFAPRGAEARIPQMRDLMRKLVPKI